MLVLEISNLKKSYVSPDGEDHSVIDIPRFSLLEKEHIALQGTSGTGKTTLLHLIAGIHQPDSGKIVLAGEEVSSLPEPQRDRLRATAIGYVFQTFNLLEGYTALENIELGMMFGPGLDTKFAKSLLERVGLKDRMNYKPRQLSVGQQQRVAVARALANHPKLVLADEPTGNLDHKHATEAMHLIRGICSENGAALFVVSHDQNILSQFGRVEQLSKINRTSSVETAVRV